MKLKLILSLVIALASFTTLKAQKVKLKKGIVLIDGEPRFEYKKSEASSLSIYTLNTQNEIIFIHLNSNGTITYLDDDYKEITFINEKRKLESSKLRGAYKLIIQKLIQEKVLNLDGSINSDKLDTFFTKFDENITNRTIRG